MFSLVLYLFLYFLLIFSAGISWMSIKISRFYSDLFARPSPTSATPLVTCRRKLADRECESPFLSILLPQLEKMETLDEVNDADRAWFEANFSLLKDDKVSSDTQNLKTASPLSVTAKNRTLLISKKPSPIASKKPLNLSRSHSEKPSLVTAKKPSILTVKKNSTSLR